MSCSMAPPAREITGGRRHRLLAYDAYLSILSEGTEPLELPSKTPCPASQIGRSSTALDSARIA
jgi:hypothetical protein